jgi:hypothetical protein
MSEYDKPSRRKPGPPPLGLGKLKSIRFPFDMDAAVEREAYLSRKTVSDIVREAVRSYLADLSASDSDHQAA